MPTYKPYFKRSKSGVTRIIRDNYGPPKEWFSTVKEVRARDGDKCIFCGSTENLHTHHFNRLSRGGVTSNANLGTVCERCHRIRHPHLNNVPKKRNPWKR